MAEHNTDNENVSVPHEQGEHITDVTTIQGSPMEVYAFWKDEGNIIDIVPHLTQVENNGNRGSWTFSLPAGAKVVIPMEIINEIPGEVIAWRSLDGSPVANAGAIRFTSGSAGTEVRLEAEYKMPLGVVGSAAAKVLGAEPKDLVRRTLDNLRMLMETGEIATTEGQSSGRG